MTEIPDDIMQAARVASHTFLRMAPCYPEQFQLQDTIARAIMAERERAAKVAFCHVGEMPDDDAPLSIYDEAANGIALAIAAAIRKGTKP